MIQPLTSLETGKSGVVAAIRGSAEEVSSLRDLGLRIGGDVKVLHGGFRDTVMVAVGDARVGINYAMARQIYVR